MPACIALARPDPGSPPRPSGAGPAWASAGPNGPSPAPSGMTLTVEVSIAAARAVGLRHVTDAAPGSSGAARAG